MIPGAWECVACGRQIYAPGRTGIPHHPCPELGGLMAPMAPAGTAGKLERVVRQDYVGNQLPQTDDTGRPVMAVVLTRDDGQDCSILAPIATSRLQE